MTQAIRFASEPFCVTADARANQHGSQDRPQPLAMVRHWARAAVVAMEGQEERAAE